MPVITAIKPQKNKKRLNIYLDDKFGFSIDLENFVVLRLKVDQEFSEEEIKKIIEKADFQKTYNKLLRFATLRPRSYKEITDWFKRKEVAMHFHEKLIAKLTKLELLDDDKFAKWWVEQRLQFKLKSQKELIYELKVKGINQKIINNLVHEVFSKEQEDMTIKKLLDKNSYKWDKFENRVKRHKMLEFLVRKGFSYGDGKRAIDETITKK